MKNCSQTDTRPRTKFFDGICPVCRYHSTLKGVVWGERREEIYEIVEFGRNNNYDCIIPVIGVPSLRDKTCSINN